MKLYLSSYRLGNEQKVLQKWIANNNNKILVIPNALDAFEDSDRKTSGIIDKCKDLEQIGFETQIFDLRKYFRNSKQMREDIKNYNTFYVLGGNVFILRKAMKLSGFDEYLKEISILPNYLYSGFSAGICVLSKNLHGIDLADEPNKEPYNYGEIIWEGIGLIDYMSVPHFDTPNHPESHLMYNVVSYLEEKDGDVFLENIGDIKG